MKENKLFKLFLVILIVLLFVFTSLAILNLTDVINISIQVFGYMGVGLFAMMFILALRLFLDDLWGL